MDLQFHFEKRGGVRAYRQLHDQILEMIRANVLKPGDRLWPERQLAEMTGLARGTIKHAYGALRDEGILEARVGGGHFIVKYPDDAAEQRRRLGAESVDELFGGLRKLNFSVYETYALIQKKLHELINEHVWLNVAVVECSKMGCIQLAEDIAVIPGVVVTQIELTDVHSRAAEPGFFPSMDLIVTTTAHYEDLCHMLSSCRDRIVEVFFSLTNESISQFHKIRANSRIGVLTADPRTFTAIRDALESFNIRYASLDAFPSKDAEEVRAKAREKDVLIIVTDSFMLESESSRAVIDDFEAAGGEVVMFTRLLEKASRRHVENVVAKLVARKCSEFTIVSTGRNYLPMV